MNIHESMLKEDELELSIVDKDIADVFRPLIGGRYQSLKPTLLHIARYLKAICNNQSQNTSKCNNSSSNGQNYVKPKDGSF